VPSETQRREEQVRYQATHDALTGLSNYREFMETLEREVRRAERSHHSFTVMLLDLDDLKRINDRLGSASGEPRVEAAGGSHEGTMPLYERKRKIQSRNVTVG
jgi:GGDEF domain-containing protein